MGYLLPKTTPSVAGTKGYRDKIYIIKDIILLLAQYGELNQTTLVSYSGLNLKKHKHIIDELESRKIITKTVIQEGKRTVTIYKTTAAGMEFCRNIIEPYEDLFPRKTGADKANTNESKLSFLVLI